MKLTKARISLLLTIVILVTVGAVALRFFDERQGRAEKPAETQTPPGATMALTKVSQTAVKDGTKEWHLEAAAATLLEAEYKMVLERPEVEFYMQNGDVLTLTAREGTLDTETNDIQVSGQVVVRHREYTLTGEAFAYHHERQLLTSQSPVEIHSRRLNLSADRMTVDLNTQETGLAGNVKGILNDAISL